MAHVSELAPYRIEKPSDFLNIGDEVTVKIKEIDDQGRVNLTLKGLEENAHLWKDEKGKSNGQPSAGGFRPSRFGSSGGNDRGGARKPGGFVPRG
jgi:polyribonucleotide nucleotidyltransferase